MATRLRISQRVYQDDEATDGLEQLGDIGIENGKLKQYPLEGQREKLRAFVKGFRNYGDGPAQNDQEFLDALPGRVGFYRGKASPVRVKNDVKPS